MYHQVNRDSIDYTDPFDPEEGHWGVYEEYWYDALGRRVLKRSRQESPHCEIEARCLSSIERYVWSGDQLLWEIRSTNSVNLNDTASSPDSQNGEIGYVHAGGVDAPFAMIRNGQTQFLHLNWRDQYAFSTKTDGSLGTCTPQPWAGCDTVPWAAGYKPYLETRQVEYYPWWGSLATSYTDATGLLYRRNRYYDAGAGVFSQEDPIGIAGGLNLYGYADGDPINNSDPFGLCIWDLCTVESALVAGLFVGSAYLTAQVSSNPGRTSELLESGANAVASVGSRLRKLGEIITIGVSGLFGQPTPPKADELLNPETKVEQPAPQPSGRKKPKDDEDPPGSDDPPTGGR